MIKHRVFFVPGTLSQHTSSNAASSMKGRAERCCDSAASLGRLVASARPLLHVTTSRLEFTVTGVGVCMLVHVQFGTRHEASPMNAGAALSVSSNCNADEETPSKSCDKRGRVADRVPSEPCASRGTVIRPSTSCASRGTVAEDDPDPADDAGVIHTPSEPCASFPFRSSNGSLITSAPETLRRLKALCRRRHNNNNITTPATMLTVAVNSSQSSSVAIVLDDPVVLDDGDGVGADVRAGNRRSSARA